MEHFVQTNSSKATLNCINNRVYNVIEWNYFHSLKLFLQFMWHRIEIVSNFYFSDKSQPQKKIATNQKQKIAPNFLIQQNNFFIFRFFFMCVCVKKET